jgi:hypothetical protein
MVPVEVSYGDHPEALNAQGHFLEGHLGPLPRIEHVHGPLHLTTREVRNLYGMGIMPPEPRRKHSMGGRISFGEWREAKERPSYAGILPVL